MTNHDLDRLVRAEVARRSEPAVLPGQHGRRRRRGWPWAPLLLGACGDDDEGAGGGGGGGSATTVARTESDTLRISNWPLYIDEETVTCLRGGQPA